VLSHRGEFSRTPSTRLGQVVLHEKTRVCTAIPGTSPIDWSTATIGSGITAFWTSWNDECAKVNRNERSFNRPIEWAVNAKSRTEQRATLDLNFNIVSFDTSLSSTFAKIYLECNIQRETAKKKEKKNARPKHSKRRSFRISQRTRLRQISRRNKCKIRARACLFSVQKNRTEFRTNEPRDLRLRSW